MAAWCLAGCPPERPTARTGLLGDTLLDVKVSPSGKVGALLVDPDRIPAALDGLGFDPCLAGSYFRNFIDGEYMTRFGHDVDFIVFVIDNNVFEYVDSAHHPAFATTHYAHLRHFEEGLGLNNVPNENVGPPSLRGYALLAVFPQLVDGQLLHEVGHAWGVYLEGPPALIPDAFYPVFDWWACVGGPRTAHWNNAHVNGVMGGQSSLGGVCTDDPLDPDGPYGVPYAPLELYLMGLAGPEDVPPIDILPATVGAYCRTVDGSDEAVCVDDATGETVTQEMVESLIVSTTIDEIIEYNGARVPSAIDSPKQFRAALFVFTVGELSDERREFYDRSIDFLSAAEDRSLSDLFSEDEFGDSSELWPYVSRFHDSDRTYYNFHMATGGRATLEFIDLRAE